MPRQYCMYSYRIIVIEFDWVGQCMLAASSCRSSTSQRASRLWIHSPHLCRLMATRYSVQSEEVEKQHPCNDNDNEQWSTIHVYNERTVEDQLQSQHVDSIKDSIQAGAVSQHLELEGRIKHTVEWSRGCHSRSHHSSPCLLGVDGIYGWRFCKS